MDVRDAILKKQLQEENSKNNRIIKLIKQQNPEFANHMFQENELIEKFITKQSGGLDLLNQPVCEQCEKPASWDKDGAYCFHCNHKTKNPKTVREYLSKALKGFDLEKLIIMNGLGE